jgi:hypothetical protein
MIHVNNLTPGSECQPSRADQATADEKARAAGVNSRLRDRVRELESKANQAADLAAARDKLEHAARAAAAETARRLEVNEARHVADRARVVAEKERELEKQRAQAGLALTPGGCQLGYMEHTGCHQSNRVLTHNNNVGEKCQPSAQAEGLLADARRSCFQEVDRSRREAQYAVENTRRSAEEETRKLTAATERQGCTHSRVSDWLHETYWLSSIEPCFDARQ